MSKTYRPDQEKIISILMTRDDMTRDDAESLFDEAVEMCLEGFDPEDVLHDELGLEPDYFFALIG